ncbi:MAG: TraR/DksA family transcriptional regulator [Planctomycetaceae bacterium]
MQFKQILQALRARLRGDVEHLTDGALDRTGDGGESKSPTHIAELGTEAYEQDFALRFVESDRNILEEIEAALERVEDGTYGVCCTCREEGRAVSKSMIPKTRLRAIPYARNCVNCERKLQEMSS